MQVRLARPQEHDRIGEITVAAYSAFTLGPGDPYVERLRDAAGRAASGELWVATDGDALLGSVTYCPPGSSMRELALPHEGEFRMLAVDPAAHGRGAGEALVRTCHRRAVADGASAMVLSSLPVMAAAHRLYGRLGYRRQPDRDWTPAPGVDLVAFAKELP